MPQSDITELCEGNGEMGPGLEGFLPHGDLAEILRDSSHQACQGQNFRFVTAKSAFPPLLQQGRGGVFPGVGLSLRGHCIQGKLS